VQATEYDCLASCWSVYEGCLGSMACSLDCEAPFRILHRGL
jgi:hypothetical protein